MSGVYKNSIVMFLDLLGFRKALEEESNASYLLELLQQIKKNEREEKLPQFEIIGPVTNFTLTPCISAFSDSLIVSFSEVQFVESNRFRHAVIEAVNIVQQLAFLVIQKGFLIRGGISYGKLYHKDGIVFGPALVEARYLEKKAVHPRIVADNSLVELFRSDRTDVYHEYFKQDEDGCFSLDYLPVFLKSPHSAQQCFELISQTKLKLEDAVKRQEIHVPKYLDKWRWFEEACLKAL